MNESKNIEERAKRQETRARILEPGAERKGLVACSLKLVAFSLFFALFCLLLCDALWVSRFPKHDIEASNLNLKQEFECEQFSSWPEGVLRELGGRWLFISINKAKSIVSHANVQFHRMALGSPKVATGSQYLTNGALKSAEGKQYFAKGSKKIAWGEPAFAKGSTEMTDGRIKCCQWEGYLTDGGVETARGKGKHAKGRGNSAEGAFQSRLLGKMELSENHPATARFHRVALANNYNVSSKSICHLEGGTTERSSTSEQKSNRFSAYRQAGSSLFGMTSGLEGKKLTNASRSSRHLKVRVEHVPQPLGISKTLKVSKTYEFFNTKESPVLDTLRTMEHELFSSLMRRSTQRSCGRWSVVSSSGDNGLEASIFTPPHPDAHRDKRGPLLLKKEENLRSVASNKAWCNSGDKRLVACSSQLVAKKKLTIKLNTSPSRKAEQINNNALIFQMEDKGKGDNNISLFFTAAQLYCVEFSCPEVCQLHDKIVRQQWDSPLGEMPEGQRGEEGHCLTTIKQMPMKHA